MAEYIERDALLSEIQTMRNQHLLSKCDGAKVERMARQLPAAEVAPMVHGRWIRTYEDCDLCHKCSLCGKSALLDGNEKEVLSPWCPHCGAKMDLE